MSTEDKTLNREKQIEKLKLLRPIDDTFMRCIFRDNTPLVQKVLRIIMDKPDLNVIRSETQADMKRLLGARSLCLDVYADDSDGKEYDIEVQRADTGASEKRARYHSSAIDSDVLDAKEDFEDLPESYVIFITENDFYHKGLPFYRIERINIDTGEPFNDGEHILYVNGEYRGDNDLGNLMHDFSCSNPDEMIDKEMAEISRYYKETKEGQDIMCKVMEDYANEVRQEMIIQNIKKIMEKLKYTAEQAMDSLDIPSTEQSQYKAKL